VSILNLISEESARLSKQQSVSAWLQIFDEQLDLETSEGEAKQSVAKEAVERLTGRWCVVNDSESSRSTSKGEAPCLRGVSRRLTMSQTRSSQWAARYDHTHNGWDSTRVKREYHMMGHVGFATIGSRILSGSPLFTFISI
jgi:hypothetical protein